MARGFLSGCDDSITIELPSQHSTVITEKNFSLVATVIEMPDELLTRAVVAEISFARYM